MKVDLMKPYLKPYCLKLVVCLPDNGYQRFIGKEQTHHIKADRPLVASEVEELRVDPEGLLSVAAS